MTNDRCCLSAPRACLMMFTCLVLIATASQATPWRVVPDPTSLAWRIPATSRRVAVPAAAVNGHAIFSSTESPFVALSELGNGTQVWSLKTGKAVTAAIPLMAGPGNRLRSDGRMLVGDFVESGKRYTAVWDTKSGKRVWTSPTAHRVSPQRDFGSASHVIEATSKSIIVWDYEAGRKVREIACDQFKYGAVQFSPTRKYLARPTRSGVQLYDVTLGELAGEVTYPKFDGRELRLLKLDFSADGKEMVALLRASRDRRDRSKDTWAIASWTMKDGKLISRHEIPRDVIVATNPFAASADIDCLPDHSGWLLRNSAIVDRRSGKVVWIQAASPGPGALKSPSIVLADGRLLLRPHQPGSPTPLMIVIIPPRDVIRERVASLAKNPNQSFIERKADTPLAAVDWKSVHARVNRLKSVSPERRKRLAQAKVQQLLAQLDSQNVKSVETAVETFGAAKPLPAMAGRVAEKLRSVATKQPSGFITVAGHWVAGQWAKAATGTSATPPGEKPAAGKIPNTGKYAALEAEITSGDLRRMQAAFNTLATSADAEAAKIVVKHFTVNRAMSTTTLMRIGAPAAPVVTKLLESPNVQDRQMGLVFLFRHGTRAELPAIEKLTGDANLGVRAQAKSVAKQIQKRGNS